MFVPNLNFKFALDSPAIGPGFFNGRSAVSGMAAVSLYEHRRCGGWYNTLGGYEVVKQHGRLAKWCFWNGLYPSGPHEPVQLDGLNRKMGPPFFTVRSGSNFTSAGYLTYLLASKARTYLPSPESRGESPEGEGSQPPQAASLSSTCQQCQVPLPTITRPQLRKSDAELLEIAPPSFAACALCALDKDWGTIVLHGGKNIVDSFTRGRFLLRLGPLTRSSESPGKEIDGEGVEGPGVGRGVRHGILHVQPGVRHRVG